ncbi:acyl-CoA thioesterase [Nocardioides hwasunensis]|uniref:Thioesterase family protein n=1 Tax=Nocardioides hwasunensis TaxID=397258 RepID=A0ABR8MFN7_9ACTN|nr:thioesterase family protein [Nocardioides hwasunensis]MBD3914380.1 thioesterase family protein [Nocardioides hwasunensis]
MGDTYTTRIQARYRDINLAGHVDNVEAVRILDEARLEFFRFAPLPDLPAGRTGLLHALDDGVSELVASQAVEYHAEMRFVPYQPFLATLWVSRIGGSSFTVGAEIRVEEGGAPAVAWECATVLWDRGAQAPWPISERVRSDLERYLGDPVAMRR